MKMSKELADKVGLVEGEKAIFLSEVQGVRILKAVTIEKIFSKDDNVRVNCAEFGGYVMPRDLYSKGKIMRMLGEKEEHDYSFIEVMIVVSAAMLSGAGIGILMVSML